MGQGCGVLAGGCSQCLSAGCLVHSKVKGKERGWAQQKAQVSVWPSDDLMAAMLAALTSAVSCLLEAVLDVRKV